jgi:hypothetical protein
MAWRKRPTSTTKENDSLSPWERAGVRVAAGIVRAATSTMDSLRDIYFIN